jgi:sulfatase modifying factor 1
MLASRKSKSVCLVCNGTGLLNKNKKSKSRHNPADLCPNCIGSGSLRNNPEEIETTSLSKNAVIGLSVLGVLSLGGLALFLTSKKDSKKPAEDSKQTEEPVKITLKAGDVSVSPLGVEMVFCPKGDFTMGHVDEDDNKPRLEKIETPFWLGKTEVTQSFYEKITGVNPSTFKDNNRNPVESVSWDGAVQFCNKLSEAEGLELCYTKNSGDTFDWSCDFSKNGYRLPTEKEWEYAAKAGTNNRWAGTDNEAELPQYAWYGPDDTHERDQVHVVGGFKPNGWGLYDMSGNVSEWCWEIYDTSDKGHFVKHVHRGGNWMSRPVDTRVTFRNCDVVKHELPYVGFRVCRTFIQ